MDLSGTLEFSTKTPELTVGWLPLPAASTTWEDLDQQLGVLLEEYLSRVDPDMTLGIDSFSAIIGYQIGEHFTRRREGADANAKQVSNNGVECR